MATSNQIRPLGPLKAAKAITCHNRKGGYRACMVYSYGLGYSMYVHTARLLNFIIWLHDSTCPALLCRLQLRRLHLHRRLDPVLLEARCRRPTQGLDLCQRHGTEVLLKKMRNQRGLEQEKINLGLHYWIFLVCSVLIFLELIKMVMGIALSFLLKGSLNSWSHCPSPRKMVFNLGF